MRRGAHVQVDGGVQVRVSVRFDLSHGGAEGIPRLVWAVARNMSHPSAVKAASVTQPSHPFFLRDLSTSTYCVQIHIVGV